jgi:shikimate dehydrogenase
MSPVIQNAAFHAADVDAVYVALRSSASDLAHLMRGISAGGGAGNVTLPHKEKAATVVTAPSDAVRRTGACNTFWGDGAEIRGDNTDVEGFVRALRSFLGHPPTNHRVLLLGAGGAARAALVGLLDDGVEEVLIMNRTTERARAVARRIGGKRVRVADGRAAVQGESFDLVVNATRLGLDERDPLPVDLELFDRVGAVLDLVYGSGTTAFVRTAERRGLRAADGREMLVQQGAVAFERWTGQAAPVDAMRDALRVTLTAC